MNAIDISKDKEVLNTLNKLTANVTAIDALFNETLSEFLKDNLTVEQFQYLISRYSTLKSMAINGIVFIKQND